MAIDEQSSPTSTSVKRLTAERGEQRSARPPDCRSLAAMKRLRSLQSLLLPICAASFSLTTLTACGSGIPVPNERLSSAEGATRSAHELDAENDPQAALHLKLANEQIEKAKAAIKNED